MNSHSVEISIARDVEEMVRGEGSCPKDTLI